MTGRDAGSDCVVVLGCGNGMCVSVVPLCKDRVGWQRSHAQAHALWACMCLDKVGALMAQKVHDQVFVSAGPPG